MNNSGSIKNCGSCRHGKPHGWAEVWCRLFGIMVTRKHEGCKYHGYGGKDNDEKEQDPAE